MANLAMGRSLNCAILVHNERPATDDEEWDRWIAFVADAGPAAAHLTRVLVFSAGGSPTPKQRAKINVLTPPGEQGVLTAIVIPSLLARGVVSALTLFNPGVRAFAPERLQEALGYLRISSVRQPEVIHIARALHAELGIPFAPSL
jgi:hypothetical protein